MTDDIITRIRERIRAARQKHREEALARIVEEHRALLERLAR